MIVNLLILISIFFVNCVSATVTGITEGKNDATVIVLGAGVAGIQAAAQLSAQGITDFIIVEQSGRIGGRMLPDQWAGLTIELGCNWIEGPVLDENPLWTIAQKINLQGHTTNIEDEPTMYNEFGKQETTEVAGIWSRLNTAMSDAHKLSLMRQRNDLADISLREALTSVGWISKTPMERTAEYFYVEWEFEYSAEDVSLYNFFPSVALSSNSSGTNRSPKPSRIPRNVYAALKKMGSLTDEYQDPEFLVTDSRGFIAVLQYIADTFLVPNDPRLMFNTLVTNIEYDLSSSVGVKVTTADGKVLKADYAICTFSVGVVNQGFESGLFSPRVPLWKSKAFGLADMGVFTKVFLKFETNFWDDVVFSLYADSNKTGYLSVWQNLEAHGYYFPTDSNVFMVTATNSESERLETQDLNTTIAEVKEVLKKMYGSEVAAQAVDIRVPVWKNNPHFLGSYSNIGIGNSGSTFSDMEKNLGGLWFAGEAMDWNWNGFVVGAYYSGDRVAKCVAKTKKLGAAVPCLQN